ncbi:MAG TPA: hypothetical protein VM240_11595 [Verrucomicrobiae bacterium]|nr:hypothetical protein [Verrucomicrobiae bacterium]
MACLLWWVGLPAGAQDSSGTDVFEANESPQQALQRIQKAKNRPLRRGGAEPPAAVPYLSDDSLRSGSLTGSNAPSTGRDFPGNDPVGHDRDPAAERDEVKEEKEHEEAKEEKDHDKDKEQDDAKDDDDHDDEKKKGKG